MNYLKIEHEDVCNGTGLRVVLWLSGCSHHCYNCQNPQTWNPDSGIPFDESAKQEIFNELSKDYISGITFSGGDPLHENNLDEVLKLVKQIRISFPEKTIWLYTGFCWNDIMCSFAGLQADCVVLDNSYSGDSDEWKLPVIAMEDTTINKNDRICQFRINKIQPEIEFEEVEHLDEVSRGGIGSTGKA